MTNRLLEPSIWSLEFRWSVRVKLDQIKQLSQGHGLPQMSEVWSNFRVCFKQTISIIRNIPNSCALCYDNNSLALQEASLFAEMEITALCGLNVVYTKMLFKTIHISFVLNSICGLGAGWCLRVNSLDSILKLLPLYPIVRSTKETKQKFNTWTNPRYLWHQENSLRHY